MNRSLITALIVASSLIMENIDGTVIATSLPLIAADLGTTPLSLKLAMTSYMLALAIFIPASGWVADRFGARNVFRIALVVFVAGSIMSGLSQSLEQLVAARVIQGIGGSMMTPVGRLIVLRSVPRERMIEAFTWLTFPAMIGPMIGPPLGGFITTYSSWRLIFFINVPIAILGVILATRFIPDVREEDPGIFDFKGFVLTALGFTGVVFGFSLAGGHFISAGPNILLILAGVFFLWLYVRHARHHPNPLLDLTLFKLDTFRRAIIGGTVFRLCMGAVPFLLPLMLQLGFGLSPLNSGLLTMAMALGALATRTMVARAIRAMGFRKLLIASALLTSLFYATYASFRPDTPQPLMFAVMLFGGLCTSMTMVVLNTLGYADIPRPRMGHATAMSSMAQQLSVTLGVVAGASLVGLTHHLHGGAGDTLGAADFPPAYIAIGLMTLISFLAFLRLPPDVGDELRGGHEAPVPAQPSSARRQR